MKKNECATFGQRLRRLRAEETQARKAAVFGVRQQTYAGWENDRRQPDLTAIRCICEHYNISADYLVGLSDVPFSPAPAEAEKRLAAYAAETPAYERPQQDPDHWRGLAAAQQATIHAQQATIASLAAMLAKTTHTGNGRPAKTPPAPYSGRAPRAG